jgi:hypothetical protein
MRFSIRARLVIASDGENREVDSKADENRAKTDADHAESSEKKLPERQRNQAREQKTKCHAQQRQPSAKTYKENCAYQQNRANQRRDDVVAHAQRNFRYKSRAPGHENLQVTAIPSLRGGLTKPVYFAHQTLAFKGADGVLVRRRQEYSHRAIW